MLFIKFIYFLLNETAAMAGACVGSQLQVKNGGGEGGSDGDKEPKSGPILRGCKKS